VTLTEAAQKQPATNEENEMIKTADDIIWTLTIDHASRSWTDLKGQYRLTEREDIYVLTNLTTGVDRGFYTIGEVQRYLDLPFITPLAPETRALTA
jgi:hypothetical protein